MKQQLRETIKRTLEQADLSLGRGHDIEATFLLKRAGTLAVILRDLEAADASAAASRADRWDKTSKRIDNF